ncbi:ammonium transporter [Desulfovibrio sp. X2]|uniref:ammonium transporter n=1 Tax=Desulfovibrio sp. X2 TaxID=941449 RepID=UPI000358A1E8|nr:ammonium transporter [Desulfovibrio sp. X2]EPR36317.1 ammonium transporter [Desulfovibrio sp. X2]
MVFSRYTDKSAVKWFAAALAVACAVTVLPGLAHAEDAPEMLSQANANIMWTLIAGMLVFFMQAGFACVEAGFTRAKSAGNIVMKNLLDFGAGQIVFLLIGFGLMFGTDVSGFIGTDQFGLKDVILDYANFDAGGWSVTFWFFQSVFAGTAATIVSGAMAERTKFSSYILLSIFVTAVIYPVSGHWAWGSLNGDASAGWLSGLGFIDFAGSTVVHSCGGWVALAGAIALGPRLGKYNSDGEARAIPGHNIPLGALGVFILWFGWFGFNPGSTTTANNTIGLIAVNTSLAACAGTLGALALSWFRFGKPDMSMTMNGTLAGLVAITSPCYTVSPMGSITIGALAGLLVVLSIEFIDKVLKIDDPVGAVSVHGVCGAWGTLSAGLFTVPGLNGGAGGLFYGGGLSMLGVQALGVAATFVWAFGAGLVLMFLVKAIFGIRVTADEEMKGLDLAEHGSEAYAGFQIFRNE